MTIANPKMRANTLPVSIATFTLETRTMMMMKNATTPHPPLFPGEGFLFLSPSRQPIVQDPYPLILLDLMANLPT